MFDPMMIPGIAAIAASLGGFGYAHFVLKPRQEERLRVRELSASAPRRSLRSRARSIPAE